MTLAVLWWSLLNLFTIILLAFYSMSEMACVSFNKVRLQYYVTKGIKQAIWLNKLLQNPSVLFGTTLIGVNVATVVGSECARETYAAMGLSPDLAPLTQVILVVIFGELAPMFAARHYAEHVTMLTVPLLYASAQVMKPLLFVISLITTLLGGKKSEESLFLTQEELLKILEEQDDTASHDEFQEIASNIFKLRHLTAGDIMKPLTQFRVISSDTTVGELKELLSRKMTSFCPIYHRNLSNIVGIALIRNLLRAGNSKRVRDFSTSPWFITTHTTMMDVMQQFRRNRQNVAIVINSKGSAIGIITLDMLMNEVISFDEGDEVTPKVIIDRTLPGEMTLGEFEKLFGVTLGPDKEMTLAELITSTLGHHPDQGDSIYIEPYEIEASDTTITEITEVTVSTKL